MSDEELVQFLRDNSYFDIRDVPGRGVCGLMRFIYTVGVCYGMDDGGYQGRICFSNLADAIGFLAEWDGAELPAVGQGGVTALK